MAPTDSVVQAPARPPANTVAEHVKRTLTLAVPVVLARSGVLIMAAVDTAMTGRSSGTELAYIGIGIAPTISLMLVGLGLLMGVSIMVAQADGAEAHGECGMIWRVGMWHAAVLGLVFLLICQFGEWFLLAIGQDPGLAEGGGRVIAAFGWGMPAILLSMPAIFFLEGISRPVPGMVVMLSANLVNFAFNWLTIYGNWGFPAMGAEGAMLATSATRWLIFAVLLAYVYSMRDGEKYGVRARVRGAAVIGAKLRRLGYPIAVAHGLETSAFTAMTMMAGYLGTTALAGYQISINILALIFMSAIGLATATSVRVGNAVGREDPVGLRRAGWTGLGMVMVLMAGFGLLFIAYPASFAAVYTHDPAVIAVAAGALGIAGLFVVFDGAQAVLVQALRGAGDVWIPTLWQIGWAWLIAVPCGAYFAFTLGYGPNGLMGGIFVGVVVAAIGHAIRFHIVSRRDVARI